MAIRPALLLAGDEQQLQPIETVNNEIKNVDSIMHCQLLKQLTVKIKMTVQHHTVQGRYEKFLRHIRHWQPSQKLLDDIQDDRILHEHDPTDEELLDTLMKHPLSTVITVSHNAANSVNKAVIKNIFENDRCLGQIICDSAIGNIPAYAGLRVMITQNIDKSLSIVNGRLAEVIAMEGVTVFLRLQNQCIVHVYPVSHKDKDGCIKTVHPLMPAYALTIPKAQGQTAKKCIVWLDSPVVAPGGTYVALSRCSDLQNVYFMVRITILPSHTPDVIVTSQTTVSFRFIRSNSIKLVLFLIEISSFLKALHIMRKARTAEKAKKPTAVEYFNQFVRSFVTPYPQAQPPPDAADVIVKRLKPFSCEWLSRPEVALSEYSEAISINMAVVREFRKSVVTKQIAKKLEEKFDPLADQFQQLIRKNKRSPTCDDVKQVLKSIINEDDGFDETINNQPRTQALWFTTPLRGNARGDARGRNTENSAGSAWQNLHSRWRLTLPRNMEMKVKTTTLTKSLFQYCMEWNDQSMMLTYREKYCVQKMFALKNLVFSSKMLSITIFV